MQQTKKGPSPKTFTLDKDTYKKVWIAKPIPLFRGGEPQHLAAEIRDFLYSPEAADVSIVVFDSWSTYADQVLNAACQKTTTDKHKEIRGFGDYIAPDKAQYMYTQGVIGRGLYDLSSTGKRSIHLSHVATVQEEIIIGEGKSREKVTRAIAHGFQSAGRAQIKTLTKVFSPGLVHLTTETSGFGAKQTTSHVAWLQKHGKVPFFAKWQNPDAPPFMSVEGQELCETFWEMVGDDPYNIGIYGEAGDGKTTLALTQTRDFWTKDMGNILYVACDPSSESLPTMWPGTVR